MYRSKGVVGDNIHSRLPMFSLFHKLYILSIYIIFFSHKIYKEEYIQYSGS